MVKPDVLSTILAALADPTRRAILARLTEGPATVKELSAPFAITQPAISRHLRVLERAGLISQDREAQRRPRRLNAAPLRELAAWAEGYRRFWQTRSQRHDSLSEPDVSSGREPSRGAKRGNLPRSDDR